MSTDLLTRVANLYGSCRSYQDRGIVLNTKIEDLFKDPQICGTPEVKGSMIRFHTGFERGGNFNFECAKSTAETGKLGIVFDGSQTLCRADAGDNWRQLGLDAALNELAKGSRGASLLVPLLLMPTHRRTVQSPLFGRQYREARDAKYNDRMCVILASEGDTEHESVLLLVDRESYYVYLIEESYTTDSGKTRSHLYMYESVELN